MQLQLISFDGPRSPEQVAASDRAGRERLTPLIDSHPVLRESLIGGIRALRPDGGEVLIVLARGTAAFAALRELVNTSELLPGEDPRLLPGPDRVEMYAVSDIFGSLAEVLGGGQR